MLIAAGSADTAYALVALLACVVVGGLVFHVSTRPPLSMATGPAFLAGGAAGGVAIPIAFEVLERLGLLS
ncbi:hypothetical protein QEZ40_000493 [Streptomyces katrae]|uniref:Permease n=1 Tax=Streptomyces katrae TaxID=68223 RepID=A0ABT7GRB2_9ACTN|nr:hypothetical protein [Streptomyces katrae]MDK9496151.1 hypothetical protein [Streptomyces katrae]